MKKISFLLLALVLSCVLTLSACDVNLHLSPDGGEGTETVTEALTQEDNLGKDTEATVEETDDPADETDGETTIIDATETESETVTEIETVIENETESETEVIEYDCDAGIHSFGEWRTVTAATCRRAGKAKRTCTLCAVSETKTIEKAEHTPTSVAAVAPTCGKTGLTEGSCCAVCRKVLVEQTTVPATGEHAPAIMAAVAPTCAKTGLTEGSRCYVCNKVLVEQTTVAKTDTHTSSAWFVYTEATCKAAGEKRQECTVCKKVLASETIAKLTTHRPSEKYTLPSGTYCGESGQCTVSTSCADCGTTISSGSQSIPEKHSMANGVCKWCGLPQSTTTGIYFGLNPDGKSYYAMGNPDVVSGKVVIGVYNNLSVTEVGFDGCEKVTTIVLSGCVKTMGVFEGCFNLSYFETGDGIKEIPSYAFRDCSRLSTIKIGSNVEFIGENAFSGCTNLYSAYFPTSRDWSCGGNLIYANWLTNASTAADRLKSNPWEWFRK